MLGHIGSLWPVLKVSKAVEFFFFEIIRSTQLGKHVSTLLVIPTISTMHGAMGEV